MLISGRFVNCELELALSCPVVPALDTGALEGEEVGVDEEDPEVVVKPLVRSVSEVLPGAMLVVTMLVLLSVFVGVCVSLGSVLAVV